MAYMKDVRGKRLDDIGAADTRKGIYVPAGFGEFWYPALATAKAGTGLARMAVHGDSIGHYFASDLNNKTWPGLVALDLQADHGDGGQGFCSTRNSSVHLNLGSSNAAWLTDENKFWKLTGTWASSNVNDGPGQTGIQSTTAGSTARRKFRGSTIRVFFFTGTTGATTNVANVSVDGATAVQIDNAGASGVGFIDITGLTNTLHDVVVTKVGAVRFDLLGAWGRNATGVVVDNYSAYGATSGNDIGTHVFGSPGVWNGGYRNQSDLFVYAKGANDANAAATDPDTFVDSVRQVLDQVRSNALTEGKTDIILFLPHMGNFDGTRLASKYATRLRGLADHFCAALVNANPVWNNSHSYANSQSLWGVASGANPGAVGTDSVHLSDIGHQKYKDLVMPLIRP